MRHPCLKSLYFFYFASVGIFFPYWPLYLNQKGFPPEEITLLVSLALLTKVFSPYVWGWIADRNKEHANAVRLGAACALTSFFFVAIAQTFTQMMLAILVFSFFWNACLPQLEVITLSSLHKPKTSYPKIRAWGSIGFIVSVLSVAFVVAQFGVTIIPWTLALSISGFVLASLGFRNYKTPSYTQSAGIFGTLNARIILLFSFCLIIQVAHGPYYSYYTLYLEELGYTPFEIGILWALALTAEIGVLLTCSKYFSKISPPTILYIVAGCCSLRWFLTGYFPYTPWILASAQLLHAVTYGIYHATLIILISQSFPKYMGGRAQALYSSVSFGIGGGCGGILASIILNTSSGSSLYLLDAMFVLIALICVYLYTRLGPPPPPRTEYSIPKIRRHLPTDIAKKP